MARAIGVLRHALLPHSSGKVDFALDERAFLTRQAIMSWYKRSSEVSPLQALRWRHPCRTASRETLTKTPNTFMLKSSSLRNGCRAAALAAAAATPRMSAVGEHALLREGYERISVKVSDPFGEFFHDILHKSSLCVIGRRFGQGCYTEPPRVSESGSRPRRHGNIELQKRSDTRGPTYLCSSMNMHTTL
ncbi:hypothetical protein [Roseinatronobacter monicus]|uniref:Uncharacterized protein n=1 Tax=Roseinatronobacter monicus TaxID=393481 RepID=A0A543KGK7_9RHOB|nr:hypothetical protein [Roseinatronobacter monicus]TQM94157.1 hypothetical protein BD293_2823 [Roseinatronobacter monicus]